MGLRFGVSRSHSNAALLLGVRQLSEVLASAIKVDVKSVVAADYDQLLVALTNGSVDFAWMPPLVCARASAQGATVVAVNERHGAITYRAGILVRADSNFRSIADLRHVRAAWTDPSSAAGCVLPRLYLRAHGGDLRALFASEKYYGSSSFACGAVADGEADVCSSFVTEIAADDPVLALTDVARVYVAASWRLRVLAMTESIAADGIVTGPQLASELRPRLCEALLKLHTMPGGAKALAELMNSDRLVRSTSTVERSVTLLRQRLAS